MHNEPQQAGGGLNTVDQGQIQAFGPIPGAPAMPLNSAGMHDPVARATSVAPFYSMQYLGGIAQLAKAAVGSRLYGDLNESQANMILMTGLEMGIPPTVALRNIGAFKGKTTITSQLMLAKVKEAGYKETIIENTAEAACVEIVKAGRAPYKVRFTMEDAKKAGLPERNALYKTMPAVMLLNRAIGLVCRYGAPEVAAGCYTPEEAMDIQDPADAPKPPQAQGASVDPARGGAPAGSTVKGRKKADPAPAAQPAPQPPPTFNWTDTRKAWAVARGVELGMDESWLKDQVIPALDGAAVELKVAFCGHLKDGNAEAAMQAVVPALVEAPAEVTQ